MKSEMNGLNNKQWKPFERNWQHRLENVLECGVKNLVQFNTSKIVILFIRQKLPKPQFHKWSYTDNKASFNVVGATFKHALNWHKQVVALAASAANERGFLFRPRKYLTSRNLCISDVSQVAPNLQHSSHI